MSRAGRRWGALAALVGLHAILYGVLFWLYAPPMTPSRTVCYALALPYADAGVLGIWLAGGTSRGWLRLSVTLAGLSSLIAVSLTALPPLHPLVLTPSLAATCGMAALLTLGLGCLGSLFPTVSRWQLRFALWEIIVSICY